MLRRFFTFVMMFAFLLVTISGIYAQSAQVIDDNEQTKEETPSDNDSDGPSTGIVPDDEDKSGSADDKVGGDASDDADAPKDDTGSRTDTPSQTVVKDESEKEDEKEIEKKDEALVDQEDETEDSTALEEDEGVASEEPDPEEGEPEEEELVEEQEAVEPEPEPEDQEPEEEEEVEDVMSIDTLSVEEPSGNWFFKRHWYQKAQSKYGQIGATISAILQSRAGLIKLNESVQNELLDSFYKEIGFNLGEANSTVDSLFVQLEELRQKKGSLDDEQVKLFELLEGSQEELEQLALDMEDVTAHDNAFERTMGLVMQQIDAAYAYQAQAFDAVQTIAKELNDLAAKGEYLKVRSYARSVKDIQVYLEGDLSRYLNTLAGQLKVLTDQITAELSQLKSVGIDIPEEARRLRGELCVVEEPVDVASKVASQENEAGFATRLVQGVSSALAWPFKALGLVSSDEAGNQEGLDSEQVDNDVAPLEGDE